MILKNQISSFKISGPGGENQIYAYVETKDGGGDNVVFRWFCLCLNSCISSVFLNNIHIIKRFSCRYYPQILIHDL